jgi:hypothetical protein
VPTTISPEISTLFDGEFKVDPYLEDHKPKIVAVLPFVPSSETEEGLETVRRGFYNHFSSLPYSDTELHRVDRDLKNAGLTDAGTRIFYNTITKNLGTRGIECRGAAKPKINYNNIVDNPVAIQCLSTIVVDARNNWWGSAPPDRSSIWDENISFEPWLPAPEKRRLRW